MRFRLSRHASEVLQERNIRLETLQHVLEEPEQIVEGLGGRLVYQSRVHAEADRMYLLRAVVALDENPPVVVTVYLTRRVGAYWREP